MFRITNGSLNDSLWWKKKRGRLKIEVHKSKFSFFFFIPSIRPSVASVDKRIKMTELENIRERIRATRREESERQELTWYSAVGSALLDFYDSVDGKEECYENRERGEEGSEVRVESATRKADRRVTIRGSHQRLFCGFDPHCFATEYFPLVPLRFGGVIHHPRRSTCRRVPASCRASRIPLSVPHLSLSLSCPSPALLDSRRSPKFSIRTLASFPLESFFIGITCRRYRILVLSLYLFFFFSSRRWEKI